MKIQFLALVFISLNLLTACDDGDIIVTAENGFEFETSNLRLCNTGESSVPNSGTAVFHNVNNTTNEAIAIEIPNRFYNDTIESTEGNETFPVQSNPVVYRKFDTAIDGMDYFCSGIPDNDIGIITELFGNSGNLEIKTVRIIEEDGDEDGDGLTNMQERFRDSINTDMDRFLDYEDSDDDNDNVLTRDEIMPEGEDEDNITMVPMDTDGDKIPDHLDPDDDNDNVDTRNEISETSPDPRNDANRNPEGVSFYLDPTTSNNIEVTRLITNTFTSTFRTTVIARNLGLSEADGSNEIIRETLTFGDIREDRIQTDSVSISTPETEEMMPEEETITP